MRIPLCIVSYLLVSSLISGPALALSIFDILQLTEKGYGSEEIISLVEATDSMFELEAEDLPKLKELGVDERVIRAMVQRVPAEGPRGLPGEQPNERAPDSARGSLSHSEDKHGEAHEDPNRVSELDEPQKRDQDSDDSQAWREPTPDLEISDLDPLGASSTSLPLPIPATPPLVSYAEIEEERSGGHHHASIAISGVEVLILRDEGSYPSVEARALEIVRRLDNAWAMRDGTFFRDSQIAGPIVVYQSAASGYRVTVLRVTAADAAAYETRSGREVSRELLASYWADLLADFGALTMGRAPNRTTFLHSGEALGVLYQALRSSKGKGGGLRSAAELMPSSTKHHLERLPVAVPSDYQP